MIDRIGKQLETGMGLFLTEQCQRINVEGSYRIEKKYFKTTIKKELVKNHQQMLNLEENVLRRIFAGLKVSTRFLVSYQVKNSNFTVTKGQIKIMHL